MIFKPAEVLSVNVSYIEGYLYSIEFRFLDTLSNTKSSKNTARPLHTFLKYIPVEGEIVTIVTSASPYSQQNNESYSWYYLPNTAIDSKLTFNKIPGVTKLTTQTNISYLDSNQGNNIKPVSIITSKDIITTPLQPFKGDFLLESRYGSSLRMSNTVNSLNTFWKSSNDSNAITILRTDRSYNNKSNTFLLETLDDDNILIQSSNISYATKISSRAITYSTRTNTITLNNLQQFNQTYISSNRLILNSTKQEAIISGAKGVIITSGDRIILESTRPISLVSNSIELISNNSISQPAVLGRTLLLLLQEILNIINANPAAPGALTAILPRLQTILSKVVRIS